MQPKSEIKYFNPNKGFGFVKTVRGDMYFRSERKFSKGDVVWPVVQGVNDKGLFGVVFTPEDIRQLNFNMETGGFSAMIIGRRGQMYVPIADEIRLKNISLKGYEYCLEGFPGWKASPIITGEAEWMNKTWAVYVCQPNDPETYVRGQVGGRIGNWKEFRIFVEKAISVLKKHGYDCEYLLELAK